MSKLSRFVFSLLSIYGALHTALPVFAAQDELEIVLEGIDYNDGLLESGMGSLVVTKRCNREYMTDVAATINQKMATAPKNSKTKIKSRMVPEPDYTAWVFYAFEGPKIRCDLEMKKMPIGSKRVVYESRQYAFDGEKMLVLKDDWLSLSPKGTISAPNAISKTLIHFAPTYYGFTDASLPLTSVLKNGDISLKGKARIQGVENYVLELRYADKRLTKFWIDPNAGFRARRIEDYDENSNLISVLEGSKYREYEGGIWLPQEGSLRVYRYLDGEQLLMNEFAMEIREFEVNVDVPDSFFTFHFPVGTGVYNLISNKGYIVGGEKLGRWHQSQRGATKIELSIQMGLISKDKIKFKLR